ncbi:MAG: hypothetical protein ACOYXN_00545 [Acidobacteriota bacterium]
MSGRLHLVESRTGEGAMPPPPAAVFAEVEASFRLEADEALRIFVSYRNLLSEEMLQGSVHEDTLKQTSLALQLAGERFREWARAFAALQRADGRWAPRPQGETGA